MTRSIHILSSIISMIGLFSISAEGRVTLKEIKEDAATKTNIEIVNQVKAVKDNLIIGTFRHTLTISYERKHENIDMEVRFWNPTYKHFPGWNSPILEIYIGGKRLHCDKLKEVGWATRAWGAYHKGKCYLYVESKHRHRMAKGVYVYLIGPKKAEPKYLSVYFSKEELQQEQEKMDRLFERVKQK